MKKTLFYGILSIIALVSLGNILSLNTFSTSAQDATEEEKQRYYDQQNEENSIDDVREGSSTSSDDPVSDDPVSDEPVSDEPVSDNTASNEPISDNTIITTNEDTEITEDFKDEVKQELVDLWYTNVDQVPDEVVVTIVEDKIQEEFEETIKENIVDNTTTETVSEIITQVNIENANEEMTQDIKDEIKQELIDLWYTNVDQVPDEVVVKIVEDKVQDDVIFNSNDVKIQDDRRISELQKDVIQEKIEEKIEYDEDVEKWKEEKIEYLKSLEDEVYESNEIVRDIVQEDIIIYGCMNESACNYNPNANESDSSCTYCGGDQICTRQKVCCDDPDWNNQCWDQRISWCTNRNACNFVPWAELDNWSCILPIWCDWNWCPWDAWAPAVLDQCWMCWWSNESCMDCNWVINWWANAWVSCNDSDSTTDNDKRNNSCECVWEKIIEKENTIIKEPIIENKEIIKNEINEKEVEKIIDKEELIEKEKNEQIVISTEDNQTVTLGENPKKIIDNDVSSINFTTQNNTEAEKEKNTVKQAPPKKIPLSIKLSDEATLEFRSCLNSWEDHTKCISDQLKNSDDNKCKNTLSWYSLWKRVILTAVDNHTCPDEVKVTQNNRVKEATIPKEEIQIEEENQIEEKILIPENAPVHIKFKSDELFVDASSNKELKEILALLIKEDIEITKMSQPFLEAGIDTIYKLWITFEEGSNTIESLLQKVYDNKNAEVEKNNEWNGDKKEIEEAVMAVPIFKIAQSENTNEINENNKLPYYMVKTWWENLINQCWVPNKKIKIAVIDNAFDISHEDLQKNIVYSYDVADDDNDTSPPKSSDKSWNHGNIAAGIIWATADNDKWVIGVWNDAVELYLFKATSDNAAWEDITAWIDAIYQAIKKDVDIINVSRWAYVDHPVVKKVIKKAEDKWIIVVAAAWNYNSDEPFYPAAYSSVIWIGALNEESKRASFSNYWPWVSNTMYWTDIESTDLHNKYDLFDWTSEASPLFAGLIWLGMSYWFDSEDITQLDRSSWNTLLELANQCEEKIFEEHDSAPLITTIPSIDNVVNSIVETVEKDSTLNTYILLWSALLNVVLWTAMWFMAMRPRKIT